MLIKNSREYFPVETNNAEIPKKEARFGARHVQAILLFIYLVIAHILRSSMGVAIVAMTSKEYETESFKSFDWDMPTKQMILSGFFWGYMVMQIPSGQIAHKFGAKTLLVVSMLVNAFVSFCIPWAAKLGGWKFILAARVIQGFTQSCLVPSIHTLMGKWAPLNERSRLTAQVYGGTSIGVAIGMQLAGFVGAYLGWPGIFNVLGVLCLFSGCLWGVFGAESPTHHKSISEEEKNYILAGLGHDDKTIKKNKKVPWLKIFSSPGMWAIVVAHVGHAWGHIILYTAIPSYMQKIMKVEIKTNGLLNAIPFLVMWVFNIFFSHIADLLINKKILSPAATRKLVNTIGSWPPALALVVLAYIPGGSIVLAETILILMGVFSIASNSGYHLNHLDISPNYAGTMMSISNFIANIGTVIAPNVNGYILRNNSDDVVQWRLVFFITAAFYFVSNLIYIIFGSATLADWNQPKATGEYNDMEKRSTELVLIKNSKSTNVSDKNQ